MQLKLGHIDYLNCAPFFHYLRESGFSGEIIKGVPAQLNEMLAAGKLDVSPSSSFEYGRRYQDYLLMPGHSISAFEQVQSVLLFSPVPIDELVGQTIYLTGESATSIHLLRVILQEFYDWDTVPSQVPDRPVVDFLQQGEPVLLIGDRALQASLSIGSERSYQYDLAELWHRHTGLPFVFALWIVHRQAYQSLGNELVDLQRQLTLSREKAFDDLYLLAKETMHQDWMTQEQLVKYWQCMSYDLTAEHLEGLELFFRLCFKYGYLEQIPEINFIGSSGD
ncbi:MAG: menaquinone biosynthesis protein [Desulfuromonas sp.]|nr:menaquinone biosynthesis protein [Desulfuromonas sp.]